MDMLAKIQETASFLQSRVKIMPKIGIILGSGLGNLADLIDVEVEMKYADIPNMPISTVLATTANLSSVV